MQWDEVLLFLSSLSAFGAIVLRLYKTITARMETAQPPALRGDEIILFALLIPVTILMVYYLLLVLPLESFDNDILLRQNIVRSSEFTSNVILAIYFLNGRLTRALRRFLAWKRRFPSS
jgi:hypothetical protein